MPQLKNLITVDEGYKHVYKEINDKDKTITHIISSGDSNRYGQVLPIDGFNENEYRKNPIVMFQHGTNDMFTTTPARDQLEFIIGSNEWLKPKNENYLMAKTKFRSGDLASDIYEGYKNGWLNAWSKYWFPISEPIYKDGFLTVEEWGIYEYSAVFVPVDSNAVTDLDVTKNFLSSARSQILKNVLSKNAVDKTMELEIDKIIQPFKNELDLLKKEIDQLSNEAKNTGDENKKLINQLKKDIEGSTFETLKQYNKKLSETIPEIVGDKIVDSLNKIGLNNFDSIIDNRIAGAIRKITGRV